MGFLKKKSFLVGAAYYIAVSLGNIFFSTPLFRTLGFEYSGIVSIFASIHLLYHCSWAARKLSGNDSLTILKKIWAEIFFLINIPFLVSIISAIFIPNCSLLDGIIFYIEIVYPTTLIALLCGVRFFGTTPKSELRRNIYIGLFWIITLIVSLLPGYFSARIYNYGWQYGYFPGFVWDEAMELSSGYWLSRTLEVAIIIISIIYSRQVYKEGNSSQMNIQKIIRMWQYWLLVAGSIIFGVTFFYQCSDISLQNFLWKEVAIGPITVHCRYTGFTEDELVLTKYNIKKYVEEIDSVYNIKINPGIDVYIFPNSDDLYEYVGTREASITKPWKNDIYITKPNLQSLKHELVHALLTGYGSFPFAISWSTGLTEGAAVAIEDDYDGIRNCDEMSARILQMKLAKGVTDIMQPSGFLSSASAQSYELSGSFSKYLLQSYGAEKYLRLYQETDFEEIYSKPLSQLEADWKISLEKNQTTMDHYDSLRTLYYFKRTSILREPCLRRIGKLLKHADEAFKEKDYKLADSLYAVIERESGRLKAIRGRVLSQLHLNNPQGALAILDTTASASEPNNLPALRLLRGDVIILATGDINKALVEWDEAMKLELGESYFLGAFMRRYFLGETNNVSGVQKILRDLYGLEEVKDKYALVFGVDSSQYDPEFYKARLFLYVSYIEKTGRLREAYQIWGKGYRTQVSYTYHQGELFDKLMERKYSHYKEVFNLRDSSIRSE
jgi:hypothetical protein